MTASEHTASANSADQSTAQPTHYLDGHALARPNKAALICKDRSLSYAELNARARRVASALSQLGVKAGDRVAVMAYNSLELLEVACGLSKLSATSVLLNYRLREHEIAYILNDCQAKAVIAGAGLTNVVALALPLVQGTITAITIGGEASVGWFQYEALLAQASEEMQTSGGGTGSTMSYTSGTTGKPKGAYRPQGVPVSVILQAIQAFELRESDVHLLAGPYYHSAPGFFTSLNLLLGATIVIQEKFDAVEALQLIEKHKITTTFLAPTLLQRICHLPQEEFARHKSDSLRSIVLAGAPCPPSLKVEAMEHFGECLWEFYGATETGVVTLLRPEDQLRKTGSCGTIAPGQEIRLLDAEGNEVPDGIPGEMWSRTSWLAEYYNNPEATASRTKQGFFSVGDIAYRDSEGYYYICDRMVDMIISGGVNIYPAEIEAVLTSHPAVADVAVIGVPDDHWGESVKAVVELKPQANASEEEIIAFCNARLADYKRPRSVDFIEEMPRNPTGKLLKTRIREPYWQGVGRRI